jgi:TPP-dependent pyruvate/acetoin dehydrogenase alpha subunit
MVEYSLATRTPVVYRGNAYKIGILEKDGLDVMTIYNLIDDAQERANQLLRYRTPDDISPTVVAASAQSYLTACQYA